MSVNIWQFTGWGQPPQCMEWQSSAADGGIDWNAVGDFACFGQLIFQGVTVPTRVMYMYICKSQSPDTGPHPLTVVSVAPRNGKTTWVLGYITQIAVDNFDWCVEWKLVAKSTIVILSTLVAIATAQDWTCSTLELVHWLLCVCVYALALS